jgi:hypothetical protein
MRKVAAIVLALAALCLLTAMGGLGGAPAGTVPQTDEDIRARLADRSGTVVELTRFSLEGNVFIEGALGSGKVSVFFRELKSLQLSEAGPNDLAAVLQLKSGESLHLILRKRALFYGATPYGAYHIVARDVERIDFLP